MMRGGSAASYSPIASAHQRPTWPGHSNDPQINYKRGQSLSPNELQFPDQPQRENSTPNLQQIQTSPLRVQEEEHTSSLEEVYICNCCGISKQLIPSIKFMSTFKCVFFLFNFLVFAFGLANLGMGLWFRIDPKVYEIHKYIETQNFTIAGWLMLFCGFAACLMSLLGFVAAARQAIVLLTFYFTVLIALTLAFVGTLVLLTVYGFGSSLEFFIMKEIYEQMRRRAMTTEGDSFMSTDATQFMDFIQVKMRCCGAADFRDYQKLGMSVPTTCYTIDKNYISAPGCGHSIRELLDLRAGLASGFALGSVVVQLFAIISSALIFCSIYHWRALPRPSPIPMSSPEPRLQVVSRQQQVPRRSTAYSERELSLSNPSLNNLHRPRSRTPIVI